MWLFGGKKRILVADDETNIRFMVEDALTSKGYDVHGVSNGAELLRSVGDLKPALILLDVMMPELDGWTTLERLKANPATRDIPVIMLTALQRGKDVDAAFMRGAKDYIPKPFSLAQLVAKVQKYVPPS